MLQWRRKIILALASVGGVGYLPVAPGTWGSLAALPLWWGLTLLGPWGYATGWVAVLALGLWTAGPAEEYLGQEDPPAIVIDEVAGQLLALAGAPLNWKSAAAGFVLFRFFDILKPFPIRALTGGPSTGLKVVLDDLLAGAMARGVLAVMVVFGGGL